MSNASNEPVSTRNSISRHCGNNFDLVEICPSSYPTQNVVGLNTPPLSEGLALDPYLLYHNAFSRTELRHCIKSKNRTGTEGDSRAFMPKRQQILS